MAFGVAGLVLIFRHNLIVGPHAVAGVAALVGGVTVQSLGLVWIKRIADRSSPIAINLGTLSVALPFFAATWWLSEGQVPAQVPDRAAAAILYLGLFGSVIGFVLYYYMIKHMETGRIALITLITPVMALLLGHALNGETVPLDVWLGTACILSGLSLHQWGGRWLRRLAALR